MTLSRSTVFLFAAAMVLAVAVFGGQAMVTAAQDEPQALDRKLTREEIDQVVDYVIADVKKKKETNEAIELRLGPELVEDAIGYTPIDSDMRRLGAAIMVRLDQEGMLPEPSTTGAGCAPTQTAGSGAGGASTKTAASIAGCASTATAGAACATAATASACAAHGTDCSASCGASTAQVNRCAEYGACSLVGDLSGASSDVLSMYQKEKASDGTLFTDESLPVFAAVGLDGEPVSTEDQIGKPTLLVFLAGHCSQCKRCNRRNHDWCTSSL